MEIFTNKVLKKQHLTTDMTRKKAKRGRKHKILNQYKIVIQEKNKKRKKCDQ